ncbi:hypothetical protein MTO96_033300 [Rhipicephalus appendiculatus]
MAIYQNSYAALESGVTNYWTHRQKFQWMSMLFMGCMYLYAARMAMPITVTKISTEYGWTKTTSGTVLCCFFWGYALTQVLGGYLGDMWGGDKVMLGAAVGWSLLTLYTPECVAWSRGSPAAQPHSARRIPGQVIRTRQAVARRAGESIFIT